MGSIFKYLSFALEAGEAATALTALIGGAKATKTPLKGTDIASAVNPAIVGVQATWGVALPAALVADIAQATADSINRYVLGL